MLFGKNSDRQRNEAQLVEMFPAMDHPGGSRVKCTYIEVPQASHTHKVLLCRPFWLWGAEMGANEYGVVIGNEAMQAKIPAQQKPALTGMDLVRLGLERAECAAQALEIIKGLLVQYGQGGNCGHLTPAYYNNGFVIADAHEAFVLETVGREWLEFRIRAPRALSNVYSIGSEADGESDGLEELVRGQGWSVEPRPCYAEVIRNPAREAVTHGGARYARMTELLRSAEMQLDARAMMRMLRDHGQHRDPATGSQASRPPGIGRVTLCMHAGSAEQASQTVGSLIAELHQSTPTYWVTATSTPCLAIYKPCFIDVPVPTHGASATDQADPQSLWWRHERLQRAAVLGDFAGLIAEIVPERDSLEEEFRVRVRAARDSGDSAKRERVVAECWREAIATEERWCSRLKREPPYEQGASREEWLRLNVVAGLHI